MIRVNKEYAIGFDSMNVILYKVTTAGEKAKNPGEERFKAINYFGSFEDLISNMLNNEIYKEETNTFQDILDRIQNFKDDILKCIKELDPDTSPYKYELETQNKRGSK